jgi:hypothetical protein
MNCLSAYEMVVTLTFIVVDRPEEIRAIGRAYRCLPRPTVSGMS